MARLPYLQHLIPTDGLVVWHSLDQQGVEAGDDVEIVTDENAHIFDVTAGFNHPLWDENIFGDKFVVFSGADDPLLSAVDIGAAINVKHLFVIASFDGAAFDDTNGLLSQHVAANGIFAGTTAGTKFFDFSLPAIEYRKSGIVYAAANMQAPMSNIPELIELKYPTGFDFENLQIGKDRDFAGRLWKGKYLGMAGFSRVLSSTEVDRIRLYANLKTRIWQTLGQTLQFPTPEIIFGLPTYSHFKMEEFKFEQITHSHTYDDLRRSFNVLNTLPPRRWTIGFSNISAAKAQVLDAFSENVGINRTFNFWDYKRSKMETGVRIENYTRSHQGHMSFKNQCSFSLVKF